jgi:hypothetical protein
LINRDFSAGLSPLPSSLERARSPLGWWLSTVAVAEAAAEAAAAADVAEAEGEDLFTARALLEDEWLS